MPVVSRGLLNAYSKETGFTSCEHLMLGAARQTNRQKQTTSQRCGCAQGSSAHTYRLRIFKERWLRGEHVNLCPSGYETAELPDCPAPRPKRQTLYRALQHR